MSYEYDMAIHEYIPVASLSLPCRSPRRSMPCVHLGVNVAEENAAAVADVKPFDFGPGGADRRKIDMRFQSVSSASRDALTRFFSAPRNDSGKCEPAEWELLKALPIFRVHGGPSGAGGGGGMRRGGGGGGEGEYRSVSGSERLFLAPEMTDTALLGRDFVAHKSYSTQQLLLSLGVERLSKARFVREHVLPRAVAGNLPRGECS